MSDRIGERRGLHRPLWERYTRSRGRVHLTGLQALVRLPLDQIRRDGRDGRVLGAVFSGYPGSPLAGLDTHLRSTRALLDRHGVRLVPGLNEELAAGTIGGTQLTEVFAHSDVDGVLGLWFGKAPGLDRALDSIRHSNFMGSARFGGALAIIGDDPFCKSSSLPSHSEHACAHAFLPLLAPADAADVLALGRHAIEISRYASLWVGMRVVADVADAGVVFDLPDHEADVVRPKFEAMGEHFVRRFDTGLLPPNVLSIESDLIYGRLEAVRRYAHANGLNEIRVRHDDDRIGIVASGQLYRELEGALALLELDGDALERLGIRLWKVDLVYPLDDRRLCEFADGLDEILVVDTRRGFLEDQLRAALYNEVDRPMVLGQRTETGEPWIPRRGNVDASTLASDLAGHLCQRTGDGAIAVRGEALAVTRDRALSAPLPRRYPHFCSGCPHSTSTRLPEDSVAGGGIGCHTMALLMDRHVEYIGAMGSEGSQWIGLEPYADRDHLFQNLGDGTYFHSGRLAVRACVEAGSTITFKLLYNSVVAMTGGQSAVGAKRVSDVARELLADGVRKVVCMSDDEALCGLARAEPRVECVTRDEWGDRMEHIRSEPGVTAMIYDEMCANHKQSLQRRGLLPRPGARLVIHEDVCEGCGDCGVKSTCASLHPVGTTLGRKTRIHESSCSDDASCLEGDCPAFLSVEAAPRAAETSWASIELPEPVVPAIGERYDIAMVGIGSTGVVTIDALVVRAAELDGRYAAHLDQTGLSQRGGKVVSHCAISNEPIAGTPRVAWAGADLLLAFDPLGACDRAAVLSLDPEHTRAVVHTHYTPAASDVTTPGFSPPAIDRLVDALRARVSELHTIPAESLADVGCANVLAANVVVLGAALQRGLLPVSAASLEQAIHDNGVAVEANLAGLRLGRAQVVRPDLVEALLADATPPAIGDDAAAPETAARRLPRAWGAITEALAGFEPSVRNRLERRLAGFALDLIAFARKGTARKYLRRLLPLVRAEAALDGASAALCETAARELYRLTAYKDEYEVARLMVRGPFTRWLRRQNPGGVGLTYHLHPPLLRAFGMGKLRLGGWARGGLVALAALKWLRGTPLDVFGWLPARRLERQLAPWYANVIATIALHLDAQNREQAHRILARAGEIRGYEDIKARRVEGVKPAIDAAVAQLTRATPRPDAPPG